MMKEFSFQKGIMTGEVGLSVFLLFALVAAVLIISEPDRLMMNLYDLKLENFMRRTSNEIQNFSLDGKFPECSDFVGKAPYCSGIVFGGVASCDCPYFTLKEVETGIFPYPGFKYVKSAAGYCISAAANNPEKGKFFVIRYPKHTEPVRSDKGCPDE